ncbi:MAG: hypothetical protein R3F17_15835 [Planctomycetota bacterium]
MPRLPLPIAALLCLSACRIDPGMALEPVLQRPRMATTTETAAIGTLQSEVGMNWDPGNSLSIPGIWRFGLTERSEAFIGGDTWRWDFDRDVNGPGNLLIGYRHRIIDHDGKFPAIAIQSETKLPTAQKEDQFGTEVVDWKFAVIVDQYIDDTHVSLFNQAGYLSEADGGGTDFEWTLAGSLQKFLDKRWSWYFEGVSVRISEQDYDARYMGTGFHYRLDSGALLDVALAAGFGDAPEEHMLLFGYTRNVGAFYRLR